MVGANSIERFLVSTALKRAVICSRIHQSESELKYGLESVSSMALGLDSWKRVKNMELVARQPDVQPDRSSRHRAELRAPYLPGGRVIRR